MPPDEKQNNEKKRHKYKPLSCSVDPYLMKNPSIQNFGRSHCSNYTFLLNSYLNSKIKDDKNPAKKLEDKALNCVSQFFDGLVGDDIVHSVLAISKKVDIKDENILLVHRIQLKWTKELSKLCHLSKNLYNHANYHARKYFFDIIKRDHNKINDSIRSKLYQLVKSSEHFKNLDSQVSRQIILYLAKNWKSYKEAVNEWYKDPSQFSGGKKPKIPGYKPSNGQFNVIFPITNLKTPGYRRHFEVSKKVISWKDKKEKIHTKTTAEIKFPKKAGIPPIRFRIDVNGLELNMDIIKEFRIIPRGNHYIFEVVYEKKIDNLNLDPNRVIGIDLGVNNLLTIANNIGAHPVIVKGKKVKHANWLGNKQDSKFKIEFYESLDEWLLHFLDLYINEEHRVSIIQTFNYMLEERLWKENINRGIFHHLNSVLSVNGKLKKSPNEYYRNNDTKEMFEFDRVLLGEQKINEINQYVKDITKLVIEYEKKRFRIWKNRNNRIQDQIHKTSRFLIEYCKKNNIGRIVIGYNKSWKQGVNLGKSSTQNFVFIPFLDLVEKIEYKAKLVGIEVIRVNESHTSKCSALDFESIEHHDLYVGKRIYRGLYKSRNGLYINADVNGAFNIMRKAIKDILKGLSIKLMQISPISVLI